MRLALSSAVAVALLATAELASASNGWMAPEPAPDLGSLTAPARLYRVTIRTSEDPQALRGEVHDFVGGVLGGPVNRPFYGRTTPNRWGHREGALLPICPLVAGLPKATGELILQRISQLAAYAQGATYARFLVAGKTCHPNLYIAASEDPVALLRNWWAREPRMYVTKFGVAPVERFIDDERPIRVWYNTGLWCAGGGPGWADFAGTLDVSGPPGFALPVCTKRVPALWSDITSAVVVIDLRRTNSITARQLADYVALISLADVRLDADPGAAPSILQLFGPGTPPEGLTPWDRALVYSLYDTDGDSREVELDMVRLLAR